MNTQVALYENTIQIPGGSILIDGVAQVDAAEAVDLPWMDRDVPDHFLVRYVAFSSSKRRIPSCSELIVLNA